MANLLIELGVEELPSPMLDVIYRELKPKAEELFRRERVAFDEVRVEATPRRIALFVKGIAEKQGDNEIEILGPSVEKAYDAQGKPTKALEGFLKSKDAKAIDIKIKETKKGKQVYLYRKEKGKSVKRLMSGFFAELLTSLAFPKMMRWEASGFRFPRPIRWLMAVWDKTPLKLEFAGMRSSLQSVGHRFLAPKKFQVKEADWSKYESLLKKHHVVLSLEKREALIRKSLCDQFSQKKLDEDLIHLNAQLIEEPYLISGTFSRTFLELPAEVLALCMAKNQKIFACYDAKGKLQNKFIAVLNGKRKGPKKIQADLEGVLISRLKDAEFFFDEDTKTKLEDKVPSLEQITYLGKLGNMLNKVKRIENLADAFSVLVGRKDLTRTLKRAAYLSKADLNTHLVFEFPEIQGIAGREYALASGESQETAQAIGTQYLPKSLNDSYMELKKRLTPAGALLGMIDRLDLLVGAFGTGLQPSGSQDPFALRRAGGSLIKILRGFGFHFSINEAIELSAQLYGNKLELKTDELKNALGQFFKERVIFELGIQPGTKAYELFQAIWKSSSDDLADVFDRFGMLTRLYETDQEILFKAAKVVERTSNILKGIQGSVSETVNPDLFTEPLERDLYRVIEDKQSIIKESLLRREYDKTTRLFSKSFYQPVHDFFEQIMVNAEDTKIRTNRQALMKRIYDLYAERLADLSVLSRIEIE